MMHPISHAVGIYLVLMTVACVVGIISRKFFRHLPYTVALTGIGLLLALTRIGPVIEETGFGHDLVFFVLLPPLLFQGAFHIDLARLRRHAIPVTLFATIGVLITTFLIGGLMYEMKVFASLQVAILFGALICTTDPVSVLAIFKENKVPKDLSYLVEGESLFNDGTGVVVFTIILSLIIGGGDFSLGHSIFEFCKVSFGGAVVGLVLGYVVFQVLKRLHDHLLENMICLVLCYGSFWIAESFHISGVIAVVCSGLLLGNRKNLAMAPKTTETVETFFESIDFLINSTLFILVGLELQQIPLTDIYASAPNILVGIVVVLLSRAIVVYPLFFIVRNFGESYPPKWSHILFWGGLRGSIPIALLLGLPKVGILEEYRTPLLVIGYGVVCFSLIVQGLTMKPLIKKLRV